MKNIGWTLILTFIIIVSISLLRDFTIHYTEYRVLKKEYDELNQQYTDDEKELEALLQDDEKQKYFRQQYGLSEGDEILFVFPEEE